MRLLIVIVNYRTASLTIDCLRSLAPQVADILVDHWLAAEFQGGDSARKVSKMDALDARKEAPMEAPEEE